MSNKSKWHLFTVSLGLLSISYSVNSPNYLIFIIFGLIMCLFGSFSFSKSNKKEGKK